MSLVLIAVVRISHRLEYIILIYVLEEQEVFRKIIISLSIRMCPFNVKPTGRKGEKKKNKKACEEEVHREMIYKCIILFNSY